MTPNPSLANKTPFAKPCPADIENLLIADVPTTSLASSPASSVTPAKQTLKIPFFRRTIVESHPALKP